MSNLMNIQFKEASPLLTELYYEYSFPIKLHGSLKCARLEVTISDVTGETFKTQHNQLTATVRL